MRPAPVASDDEVKKAGLPVSACIWSCAACNVWPRRSGMTKDCGATGVTGAVDVAALVGVSRTVTVAGGLSDAEEQPEATSTMAATVQKIPLMRWQPTRQEVAGTSNRTYSV